MSVALVALLSALCGLYTLPFIHEAYPPVTVILIPENSSTIMLVKFALLAIADLHYYSSSFSDYHD
eukprot:2164948-Ditylum_brightwellii.AAC.1